MSVCSACNFVNGDSAKFCGNCGKPLTSVHTPLLSQLPPQYVPSNPTSPPQQQPPYVPPQQQYAPAPQQQYAPSQPQFPISQYQPPAAVGGCPPYSPPNSTDLPPNPSAPPVGDAPEDTVYEGVGKIGLVETSLPPPPAYNVVDIPQRSALPQPALITEEEARAALLQYVASKCCYGKGAAQELQIESIVSSSAYHYCLESFIEKRSVVSAFVPYMGEPIDGPERGISPPPWSIIVSPSQYFHNEVKYLEVPHSSVVRICHGCHGTSLVMCWHCHGRGEEVCPLCRGHRHDHHEPPCSRCHGRGMIRCVHCLGTGRLKCGTCLGRATLRFFLKLTVTWENKEEHKYVEKTDLPDHLIKDAGGQTLMAEEGLRVGPVIAFPVLEINESSAQFIHSHNTMFSATANILKQRHVLRQVPVSEVTYSFKTRHYRYFVYGTDHRVYDDEYPHSCCCCAIL